MDNSHGVQDPPTQKYQQPHCKERREIVKLGGQILLDERGIELHFMNRPNDMGLFAPVPGTASSAGNCAAVRVPGTSDLG